MLTDAQYSLFLITPFVYLNHPGPLIVPYGITTHINSKMRIEHTKAARLFREVMGVEQSFIQNIITTVEDTYLAYIQHLTTNLINNTMADVLTHLKDHYGQLIPNELLEREDMVKNTIYYPRKIITSVFPLLKKSLIYPTSPEPTTPNISPSTLPMSSSSVLASSCCPLANGISSCPCRRCGLVSNIYLGLRTVNYDRQRISPFRMWACTTRIWYKMWWQESRRS